MKEKGEKDKVRENERYDMRERKRENKRECKIGAVERRRKE